MSSITIVFPPYAPEKRISFQALGPLYVAAVLEREGHSVKVIESNLENLGFEEIRQQLKEFNPDVVGISCIMTPLVNSTLEVAKIAKEINSETLVVVGGTHARLGPKDFFNENVDVVITGEGEYTISELLKAESFSQVKGIAFKENGKMRFTEPAPLIQDLDGLPYPARHLVPFHLYPETLDGEPIILIGSNRGCPYSCTFCSSPLLVRKTGMRFRKPEEIVKEMKHVMEKYKRRAFLFIDENFALNKEHARKICELIIKEELNVIWVACSRVTHFDKELLQLMKKAGCVEIDFGFESGNNEVLKDIHKYITTQQIREGIKLCRESGIKAGGSFMLGHHTDTIETMCETIKFAVECGADTTGFSLATPYPGTEFREIAEKQGRIFNKDYSDWFIAPPKRDTPYLPVYSPPGVSQQELLELKKIGTFLVQFGNYRMFKAFIKNTLVKDAKFNKPVIKQAYAAAKFFALLGWLGLRFMKSVKTDYGRRKIKAIAGYYLTGQVNYRKK